MLKIILKNDERKPSSEKTTGNEKEIKKESSTQSPKNSPAQTVRINRPRLFSRDVNPNSISCSPCSF